MFLRQNGRQNQILESFNTAWKNYHLPFGPSVRRPCALPPFIFISPLTHQTAAAVEEAEVDYGVTVYKSLTFIRSYVYYM